MIDSPLIIKSAIDQFDGSHTDRNMRERRTEEENFESFNMSSRSEVKIHKGSFLVNESIKNVGIN